MSQLILRSANIWVCLGGLKLAYLSLTCFSSMRSDSHPFDPNVCFNEIFYLLRQIPFQYTMADFG